MNVTVKNKIKPIEKEYAAGKSYGPFDTQEVFIASLHREAAKLKAKKTKRTAR